MLVNALRCFRKAECRRTAEKNVNRSVWLSTLRYERTVWKFETVHSLVVCIGALNIELHYCGLKYRNWSEFFPTEVQGGI